MTRLPGLTPKDIPPPCYIEEGPDATPPLRWYQVVIGVIVFAVACGIAGAVLGCCGFLLWFLLSS